MYWAVIGVSMLVNVLLFLLVKSYGHDCEEAFAFATRSVNEKVSARQGLRKVEAELKRLCEDRDALRGSLADAQSEVGRIDRLLRLEQEENLRANIVVREMAGLREEMLKGQAELAVARKQIVRVEDDSTRIDRLIRVAIGDEVPF